MRVALLSLCLAFSGVLYAPAANAIAIRGATNANANVNTNTLSSELAGNEYMAALASDLQSASTLSSEITSLESRMLKEVKELQGKIVGAKKTDKKTDKKKKQDPITGKEEEAPPVVEDKTPEEQVKAEEKEDKEATKAADAAMPFSLEDVKNMRKEQVPLFLDFLKTFVERFKTHIGEANRMEQKSIEYYNDVMAKAKKHEEPEVVVKYAKKMRAAQHKHYHSMLKLAHAGMQRIQMAIKALETVMSGKELPADWKQIQQELQSFVSVAVVQLSSSIESFDQA